MFLNPAFFPLIFAFITSFIDTTLALQCVQQIPRSANSMFSSHTKTKTKNKNNNKIEKSLNFLDLQKDAVGFAPESFSSFFPSENGKSFVSPRELHDEIEKKNNDGFCHAADGQSCLVFKCKDETIRTCSSPQTKNGSACKLAIHFCNEMNHDSNESFCRFCDEEDFCNGEEEEEENNKKSNIKVYAAESTSTTTTKEKILQTPPTTTTTKTSTKTTPTTTTQTATTSIKSDKIKSKEIELSTTSEPLKTKTKTTKFPFKNTIEKSKKTLSQAPDDASPAALTQEDCEEGTIVSIGENGKFWVCAPNNNKNNDGTEAENSKATNSVSFVLLELLLLLVALM